MMWASGFDGMSMGFGVMDTLFPIFFALIALLIAGTIIAGLVGWFRNNGSPELTVNAKVVNMRERYHRHQSDTMTSSHYVTFEVESGDRMELSVAGREYGMLAIGDAGKLTFQGTRYLRFDRARSGGSGS